MRHALRFLEPDLPAPRRLRIAYVLIGTCLLFIDLSSEANQPAGFKGTFTSTLVVAVFAAVVLSGWHSRIGGILVTLFSLIGLHLPPSFASIGISGNAIHLVCVDWISRKRIWEPIIAMTLVDVSILMKCSVEDRPYAVVVIAIEWIATLVSGLLISGARNERQNLARRVTDLEDEIHTIRHDLSLRLHDSVAGELTKIILVADELTESASSPNARRQGETLARLARSALSTTREIITVNSARDAIPVSVSSTIESSKRLLESHGFTVSADVPDNLDSGLSHATRDLLALTVREGCLNICKYAQRESAVSLSIEPLDDGAIDCLLSNRVASREHQANRRDSLSGGFGLRGLREYADSIGADLDYGQSASQWFLALSIPGSAGRDEPRAENTDGEPRLDAVADSRRYS